MRTLKIALVTFSLSLMLLPAISFAQRVQVGMKQVIVNVKGRHKLDNAIRMEKFRMPITRSHVRASTADLSARRAAGRLARQIQGALVKKFGAKGKAIAKTVKISSQAQMNSGYSYSYRNRNHRTDRATYNVSVTLPLKGNKRVRGMLRDAFQDIMKPETDRYGYSRTPNLQVERVLDQKALDKAVAGIVKERIQGAKKIAQKSLQEIGRTGKLQGAEIQSYNWSWRGPTEVDVNLKAAFGFQAKK